MGPGREVEAGSWQGSQQEALLERPGPLLLPPHHPSAPFHIPDPPSGGPAGQGGLAPGDGPAHTLLVCSLEATAGRELRGGPEGLRLSL